MKLLLNGLSLVFVVAKLLGHIGWGWWAVFIPSYIYLVIYLIAVVIYVIAAVALDNLDKE